MTFWSALGDDSLPYLVCEVGPSWCVSADRDRNEAELGYMMATAYAAKANCVKLQLKSFEPGGYYSGKRLDAKPDRSKPEWVACPFETMGDYYRAREPDERLLRGVDQYCQQHGLDWTASPWDLPSVKLLRRFSPRWVKVASASLHDHALLRAIGALGCHVVMSTGMSELHEIDAAVEALGSTPTMLHCVSSYPAAIGEIDLKVMETLRSRYGCEVGWSGHERGISASISAAAVGAVLVERHLSMDADRWGPDHKSSLEPGDFMQMVKGCRDARRTALMGSGEKCILASELPHKARLRPAV